MCEIRELTRQLAETTRAQFVLAAELAAGRAAASGRPAWATGVILPARSYLEPGPGPSPAEQLWLVRAYPGAVVDVLDDRASEVLATLGQLGVPLALLRGRSYGTLLAAARVAQESGLVPVLAPAVPLRSDQLAGFWLDLVAAGADKSACFAVVQLASGTCTAAMAGAGPEIWELPAAVIRWPAQSVG